MRMLRAFDDFLIDRVFQPITDYFSERASCYAIAAFLFTGFLFIDAVCSFLLKDYVVLLIMSVWVPARIYRAQQMNSQSRRNVMSVDRISGFYSRLIDIFFVGLAPIWLIGNHSFILNMRDMAWVLMLSGDFLMACYNRPVWRQPSRAGVKDAFPSVTGG